ncbi:prepilin-type N-terminal cleavage/methylation domain-containing protein [bacterium]|nr:prepilin-type N-terminal cleavage/methylation domain-containing protein [bacterium]
MYMKRKGFTLIELLIVVAIIGILAAIAVPNFMNAQMRAKIARVYADLRSVSTAMRMYQVDHNRYIMDPWEWNQAGFYQRGWRVYSPLTTPINYISSSALLDPFVPIENPGPTNAAWEAVMEGVYHYRNIDVMRANNLQGAKKDAHPQAGFVVRSPGPDRWYIHSPQRVMEWMAFDASNGLHSVGDIMVTDGGILGEGFQGQKGDANDL